MTSTSTGVIVGLGSDYRKDDGVGLYIARKLRSILPQKIEIIAGVADGTDLIELWNNKNICIVIDAVSSDSKSGMIHEYDGLTQDLPENIFSAFSTHAFSISRTVKLAKTINQLPARLIIYGIEGADFSAGQGLTPAVTTAADNVIRKIEKAVTFP